MTNACFVVNMNLYITFFYCVVAKQMWTNISACVNVDCGSCFKNIGRLWLSNKNFVVVNVFSSTSLGTKELYMLSGWSLEKCESSVTKDSNYDTKLEASLSSIEDVRTRAKAKQAEAFRKSTRQRARMNEDMKRSYLVSYGPPWARYFGGYQDRLLGGPLGLPDLRCTTPDGVKYKDYRGEALD
jgi:hypothetical protein